MPTKLRNRSMWSCHISAAEAAAHLGVRLLVQVCFDSVDDCWGCLCAAAPHARGQELHNASAEPAMSQELQHCLKGSMPHHPLGRG